MSQKESFIDFGAIANFYFNSSPERLQKVDAASFSSPEEMFVEIDKLTRKGPLGSKVEVFRSR